MSQVQEAPHMWHRYGRRSGCGGAQKCEAKGEYLVIRLRNRLGAHRKTERRKWKRSLMLSCGAQLRGWKEQTSVFCVSRVAQTLLRQSWDVRFSELWSQFDIFMTLAVSNGARGAARMDGVFPYHYGSEATSMYPTERQSVSGYWRFWNRVILTAGQPRWIKSQKPRALELTDSRKSLQKVCPPYLVVHSRILSGSLFQQSIWQKVINCLTRSGWMGRKRGYPCKVWGRSLRICAIFILLSTFLSALT